jgi:hypothetical protein
MVAPRLEIELVRLLEIAYATGGSPPAVEHASPYQWANACHDLWAAGRLDLTEYAARHLAARYPDLTYLSNLVALFDAMPHYLAAPLGFCDDLAADVQVVRRPGCDAVLLCFCARSGTLGLPLNFVHQWLGRLPISLIYLKDFRDLYGARGFPSLGPDRASSVSAMRRLAEELGAKRVYALGVSLGGYPALYYGLAVGADAVLSLGGATDLTPQFNEQHGLMTDVHRYMLQTEPDYAEDLRQLYAASSRPPRLLLAFSGGNRRDRTFAEHMTGLANVELISVGDYTQHNVVQPLVLEGRLILLLSRLLGDSAGS